MTHSSLLFVHSPLVGPSSCSRAAQHAAARGLTGVVPDLTGVGDAAVPRWRAFVDAAVGAATHLQPPIAAAGQSGAGVFLPAIGRELGDRLGNLVFVDAVVPPVRGLHRTPPAMKQLLDQHTVDGMLAPWLDWWPAAAVTALLPDTSDRAMLSHDLPRLPRSFYDEEVPMSAGWSDGPCSYLLLSPAYNSDFEEAADRGWARAEIEGSHLSIYTNANRVLTAVEGLVDATRD